MTSEPETVEPFTVVVSAGDLPQSILDRFREPPSADAQFAVTVESVANETERLSWLKVALQTGLDDLDAGRAADGDTVLDRLRARFPAA